MRLLLTLDPEPTAGRTARRAVGSWLVGRGLRAVTDDVTLISGELVANALQHGRGRLELEVVDLGATVRISVTDAGDGAPEPRRPAADDAGGRGLQIVAALASRWGVETRDASGKSVWAEVETPPGRTV